MSAILHTASGVVGNVGNQLQHTTSRVGNQIQITTNRVLPPKKREEIVDNVHAFANRNPKLAAFLAIQIVLTGIPLLVFLAFATTTLLVSLTTCILLGILAALAFTFIAVGLALILVVPTVFLASCSATVIFVWSFAGYLVLRRFNDGEAPGKPGTRVGDTLHGLTGGRLGLWSGDAPGGKKGEGLGTEGRVGVRGVEDRVGASREGADGVVNGVNGAHEWEEKWSNGSRKETHDLETDNVYENLKVEETIP
ncbi:hypothetical protein IQ07DRAFT_537141 [Pyrenochaeta sp. DS3sAY3a]|nr:hypothetical protein IQ07DRAFT_537141 [Pyrenochaeta sp. DS3sAY3a]